MIKGSSSHLRVKGYICYSKRWDVKIRFPTGWCEGCVYCVTHSSWEPSSNQSPWQVFHIFYNIMTRKSFTVYNHQICVPKSWPFLWHNELVCPWCSFNLNWLSWLASLVHLWSLDRTELINKSPDCNNPCFPFYLASLRQDLVITFLVAMRMD